jgi:N-terminal acetyltransferase B complex catalytic subunit
MAYILGKAEGKEKKWHGHVTAVTVIFHHSYSSHTHTHTHTNKPPQVAPEYRRLGLAKGLMNLLEQVTEDTYDGYFVDLFVRMSNAVAISMYHSFGYSIYRQVLGYYSGEEDAYDMRKAMRRDTKKESVIPLKAPITPDMVEWN